MPRQVREILAERVESRLKQLGQSKEWLGDQAGQGGAAVRKALSEGRAVRADTLAAWAKALRVSSDWLLGVSDEAPELSEQELRFACIAAILEIDVDDLSVVRDFLVKYSAKGVHTVAK